MRLNAFHFHSFTFSVLLKAFDSLGRWFSSCYLAITRNDMDCLTDLRALLNDGAGDGFSPKDGEGSHTVTFLEPPNEVDQDTAEVLDAFYEDAQCVHQTICYIEDITEALDKTHAENIACVDTAKSALLRREIAQRSSEVTAQLSNAKGSLEKMAAATAELKRNNESERENSAVVRIQSNFHFYLVRRLNHAMTDYQRRQSINQEKYRVQTARQIKIKFTKPDGSSIDDAMAEQLTVQVLENQVTNEIFQQSKNLLASITETRNDIYRIEQSMRDLHRMFNEMAILVNEQGASLDIISRNLQTCYGYLEKGRRELRRARKYQKKSRKKLYCLIGCAAFLMLLVLVIVLGFVMPT